MAGTGCSTRCWSRSRPATALAACWSGAGEQVSLVSSPNAFCQKKDVGLPRVGWECHPTARR